MMNSSNTYAIILAAGLGKRLAGGDAGSPKCMRIVGGKPLLRYVINALGLPPERVIIVVGYKKEEVLAAFPGFKYAVQESQLGTGHAAECAMRELPDFNGTVLITYGDMPMFSAQTYNEILEAHESEANDCTLLADLYEGDILPAFGRIIRDNGKFIRITEARDCTPEQLLIRELNAGVYAFNAKPFRAALSHLQPNNAQRELYLTDVPEIIAQSGGKTGVLSKHLKNETLGVTTAEDLAYIDGLLRGI